MNPHPVHPGAEPGAGPKRDELDFWRSRYALGLAIIGAAALYFLLTEHRAHLFGALPFLILMACPLMHMFMHGGHGSQGGHASQSGGKRHDGCAPALDEAAKAQASRQGETP